jgi:hypothetical protein
MKYQQQSNNTIGVELGGHIGWEKIQGIAMHRISHHHSPMPECHISLQDQQMSVSLSLSFLTSITFQPVPLTGNITHSTLIGHPLSGTGVFLHLHSGSLKPSRTASPAATRREARH